MQDQELFIPSRKYWARPFS